MSVVLWTVRTASGGQVSITPRPDSPADLPVFLQALSELAAYVDAGEHVAVHCFASRGRSGIIAILLLTLCGWAPEAAMAKLSELRGHQVPETDEQRDWVMQTAETLAVPTGYGSSAGAEDESE